MGDKGLSEAGDFLKAASRVSDPMVSSESTEVIDVSLLSTFSYIACY